MESKLYLSEPMLVKSLYIDTLIFDETDTVSLWASGQSKQKTVIVPLAINFRMLDRILRAGETQGKKAAFAIATALSERTKGPVILDLPDLIGKGITLKNFDVVVSEVLEEGKNPAKEKNRLFVVKTLYRSYKLAPRNTPKYAAGFWKDMAADAQLFYNYRNAIRNGFPDQNARKMAGIDCPVAFQRASEAAKRWENR